MNNAFIKKMNNLYIFYWLRKSICNIKWSALREMRDLPGMNETNKTDEHWERKEC